MIDVVRPNAASLSNKKTIYGWETDQVYLSAFSSDVKDRPRNAYDTRALAEAEAARRNSTIQWEN